MPGFCGTAMVRVVPPLGLSGALCGYPATPSSTSMGSGPIGSLQSALRGHLGAGDTRPGKHRKNDGKTQFFMGKSTISTGPFSIANCLFTRGETFDDFLIFESTHQNITCWTMPGLCTMAVDIPVEVIGEIQAAQPRQPRIRNHLLQDLSDGVPSGSPSNHTDCKVIFKTILLDSQLMAGPTS